MSEEQVLDYKPRARGLVIGDIPWLARISDKARAKLDDRLGDYVYPCPADDRFLREVQMSAKAFTALVESCPDDGTLIEKMKAHLTDTQ